jgi:hypothetical protein
MSRGRQDGFTVVRFLGVWLVVERLEDSHAVVGAPRVEVQRRGRAIVSHDPLHHVRWDAVVDEPGGVGVTEVVEPEPAGLVACDVIDGGGRGAQATGRGGSG